MEVPVLARMTGEFPVGLDVGSAKISVAVGRMAHGGAVELLGLVQYPSLGVRKGAVFNPDEAARAISQAVYKAATSVGVEIASACVGFTGTGVRILAVGGAVAKSGWTMILPSVQMDNLMDAIAKSGLTKTGIMLNCQAIIRLAYRELVTLSCAVVLDIGADTTSVALLRNGVLMDLVVCPVGSGNITSDLAIGLHIDMQQAEEIKCSYRPMVNKKDTGMQATESSIIEARRDEIIDLVRDTLEGMGCLTSVSGGILLVGGGARLPGLPETLSGRLGISVRIPDQATYAPFSVWYGNPEYAAVLGLLLCDTDRYLTGPAVPQLSLSDRIRGWIRKP